MDALWVALVAASAAVIASATTGWFTTRAAQAQARVGLLVQQEQIRHAQEEARHQQRRQAYATFVKAVGTVQTRLADLTSVFDDPEEFTRIMTEARADRAALMSATHEAFLEGPAHVGQKVSDLYNGIDRYWTAVRRLHEVTRDPSYDADRNSDIALVDSHRSNVFSHRSELGHLRDSFVEEAREVLNPGEATAARAT